MGTINTLVKRSINRHYFDRPNQAPKVLDLRTQLQIIEDDRDRKNLLAYKYLVISFLILTVLISVLHFFNL